MKQLFFETITYEMSDLLLDPHLDFLSFSNIKYGGGGGKIPRPGYLHPYLVLLTCHAICYLDQLNKAIILWNYYI